MLHLAIICMACAVLAPIEGTALIGVNNNKSNVFCHADERGEQRHRGKFFPGLYDVDVKNCFNCDKKQITDGTNCIFYNNFTKQCQFSKTSCSFKNQFPDRKKRNSGSQSEYTVKRRNFYERVRNKGNMFIKKLKSLDGTKPEEAKHFAKLTVYERNKLRRLKKVGKERKKRRIRKSHLDKVEIDEDLDINKRIEKLVKRIALENMRTEEKSVDSPTTEPVSVMDVSTRVSEDSAKGIAFPFFNNIKQIFRFSKEYFNSKRDSQDKRDVTITTKTERNWDLESENPKKSARLRRNVPRHFIPRKINKSRKQLRGYTRNRVDFSAVKRKRRRRKRDHRHNRSKFDSSSKHRWPLFNQMYSNYKADYNDYDSKLKEDNTMTLQKPEYKSVVTTASPPYHNSSSSPIEQRNNFSVTVSESLTNRQGNDVTRKSNMLADYNKRNAFHRTFGKIIRRDDINKSGFPLDRKCLRSAKYLKIRHALRNYIQHNSDWALKKRLLMERKKRCEGKCYNMPHKCWRSAPLLCIPYIRKGQDELLRYIIKTLQNMLGKPLPRKVDIFDKIKFKPCITTSEPTCDDIMPGCEIESSTEAATPTTFIPSLPCLPTLPPLPPPTTLPPIIPHCPNLPATEPTCSTMSYLTTNCPSDEAGTSCPASFTISLPTTSSPPSIVTCPTPMTCPPPVTCPTPVTCSPHMICPPSTESPCASDTQNNFALCIVSPAAVSPATTSLPAAGPFLKEPVPEKYSSSNDYSTDTPVLVGTEVSIAASPQSQTQIPMNIFQMSIVNDKGDVVLSSENSANADNSNYSPTPTQPIQQGYTLPILTPNKVILHDLTQGYTTVPSPFVVVSTEDTQPPTAQNTPWCHSESPIEKSEVLTFTALDCTDPNLCYKYYQSFTPPSSNEQPQISNQEQLGKQQKITYNTYVYKADRIPIQRRPLLRGSGNTLPIEIELPNNDKVKPGRDFSESDIMTDSFPEPNPKDKRLKENNFVKPCRKFRVEDEENLFPGDPFAYRFIDTTERFIPRMVIRPRLLRKKYPEFIHRGNRKLPFNYDFDVEELPSRNHQIYDEKYDRYYSPEMLRRDLIERLRKTVKNQRREKREIFYKDSYPWFKNSDNYNNYPDDSNYDDQYPENLLLPKLDLEKNHWARKREEDQNSSTPGTYALFSELAEIATRSPNETEKVSERSINTSSTETTNKTATHPLSSSQIGSVDKFDNEQKSGYDNSHEATVSILSAGYTTTLKQVHAITSGDKTTANLISTTSENKGSTHVLKSNEAQKAQIVDSGKPDKEVGSSHDIDAGEEQVMTTLKTASIVKGPKKLFTKPAPKVYTKVYPDSLPNELETNETPNTSTTPKTDKTIVVQTLAAPDVRLQLLAVCEGYLEVVKLIKAQNQSLEEELDSDLSRYCENIISQSFNLPADNVIIKSKKPERSSPSTTTTAQTAATNPNKLVSKLRSCDRYRPKETGLRYQNLRAKVVVDILRSPIYKKELAAYADQNHFYPIGRKTKRMSSQPLKTDDKGISSRKYRYKGRGKKDFSNSKIGPRNQRKEETKEKFFEKKISEEEMELLHLLRQRKRALLSWLLDPKENQMKPNDLEETEYLDDDEYYTVTAETTENSGTITPKGDQEETSQSTTRTTFYTNDTIFPVYAKQYGYDRGGELREVEVLWRRVNEETHEKKIFKNMSVLALLLTSTMAPYMKRKESKFVGGNAYESEEMSEIQSNSDNKAGFVDPSASFNDNPVTTSLPPSSISTTFYFISFKPDFKQCVVTTTTTTSSTTCSTNTTTQSKTTCTTEHQTEFETTQPNNSSKKNQTYIFMRKPDPSTIVGSPPNSTKGHKNSTHKMSRNIEIAKDFFQEYSIEFLNYAVYILPVMFTILFIMCCLCCFLQIINSRGGDSRKKKKKRLISMEEDFDTTGESEDETKIRIKKKRKKSLKNDVDCENLENRRLRAFWNVIKMNSRGKQRGDIHDETSTPTEKRRSFLQFLKGKKEAVKPEELASLSYPPLCERDEGLDGEGRIRIEANDIHDEFESGMKVPAREKKEVDERREIISLLEELKKIELENLEERKNKKSVCVQYMTQDEEKPVFKNPDIPSSYQVNKYFGSDPFSDKKFPFCDPNPEELHQELMELVPYQGDYIQRKNSLKHSDIRLNRGGRCERFLKIFRGSGNGVNFIKSGNGNKSYNYTKYKNISTDTKDELIGGPHRNADTDINLSDDMLDNFPPYSIQHNKATDIVDEMENLKRQLNKKKNVRLKDNGVLCRL